MQANPRIQSACVSSAVYCVSGVAVLAPVSVDSLFVEHHDDDRKIMRFSVANSTEGRDT